MVRNTEALGSQGQYEVIIGTLEVMGLLAVMSARRLRRARLSVKALEFPRVASAVSVGAFGHIRGALVAGALWHHPKDTCPRKIWFYLSGLSMQRIFPTRTLNKVLAVTGLDNSAVVHWLPSISTSNVCLRNRSTHALSLTHLPFPDNTTSGTCSENVPLYHQKMLPVRELP
jgi:hypothetical protein